MRRGGAQADSKAAAFQVSSCEASLPPGTKSASVGAEASALAPAVTQRIVVMGDTGCRAKQSDYAFQACSDGAAWPFADIAKNAAALKPDLVIHLGDLHYPESPCPPDLAMNGHEHVFEVLGFSSDHPATLGLGNSGTMTEGRLPDVLPASLEPAPGALINDFVTRQGLGFANLEQSTQGWRMTEFSVQGKPIFQCALRDGKSKCERVGEE